MTAWPAEPLLRDTVPPAEPPSQAKTSEAETSSLSLAMRISLTGRGEDFTLN